MTVKTFTWRTEEREENFLWPCFAFDLGVITDFILLTQLTSNDIPNASISAGHTRACSVCKMTSQLNIMTPKAPNGFFYEFR